MIDYTPDGERIAALESKMDSLLEIVREIKDDLKASEIKLSIANDKLNGAAGVIRTLLVLSGLISVGVTIASWLGVVLVHK